MEAYINEDGLFNKNISYANRQLKVTIFLSNTGNAPAYDVYLADSYLPLIGYDNVIIYSSTSYLKLSANETRHYVNTSQDGISLGQINPNEVIEVTILFYNVVEPPLGTADIAMVKYTTNSMVKYGKSNIAIYEHL